MDPVKFKVVAGRSIPRFGIQKISAKSMLRADNMIATEFSRRDFNKQIESILKKALRDTFPPGQEPAVMRRSMTSAARSCASSRTICSCREVRQRHPRRRPSTR